MAEDAAPAKRTKRGQFAKGHSGNEGGKAPGTRNRATMLAQSLLEGEAEAITRSLIREAIAGEPMALKLAVERLLPLRRGSPIAVNLPPIVAAHDTVAAIAAIVQAVTLGHLSPEEADALSNVVEAGRKTLELVDHEARIIELEATRER